jgi:hypothetical protein
MQPLPDAGVLPGPQATPRRHPAAEAELLRQVLPTDPGVQHEQDPLATRDDHQTAYDSDNGSGAPALAATARPAPTTHPRRSHGFARIDIPSKLDDGCRPFAPAERVRRTSCFRAFPPLGQRSQRGEGRGACDQNVDSDPLDFASARFSWSGPRLPARATRPDSALWLTRPAGGAKNRPFVTSRKGGRPCPGVLRGRTSRPALAS